MITTAVGNYPKVAEGGYGTNLIGAITRWQRKELGDAKLEETFREITRAVLKEQAEAGLDLLTDGHIRWEDLVTPIAKELDGFEINGLTRWFDNNVYYRRPILRRAPRWKGPILVQAYRFATTCTTKPVKAVLPGPYTFVALSEDHHYKNRRRFVLKMAEILNAEANALAAAGAPIVQFDEPALGFGRPDLKLATEALGLATHGVKAKTAVYVYFGSVDGALRPLMGANVDLVGIDVVSDPRAAAALGRIPLTKELALGCLDARNTKLESVAELHGWFDRILRRVPADRLTVNPSCGLEFLPHRQALEKLRRLTEAVRTYRPRRRR
jgi:5-methyltetrahydropteroyltriglutamate--homocysteine methyltransferase